MQHTSDNTNSSQHCMHVLPSLLLPLLPLLLLLLLPLLLLLLLRTTQRPPLWRRPAPLAPMF